MKALINTFHLNLATKQVDIFLVLNKKFSVWSIVCSNHIRNDRVWLSRFYPNSENVVLGTFMREIMTGL